MRIFLSSLFLATVAANAQAPSSATTLGADPQWKNLIQRLADPDFAVRQRADGDLAQYNWKHLPDLKAVVRDISDAEARARVLARIAQIEQEIGVDPPAISVSLQNATRRQVGTELTLATGVAFAVLPLNIGDDPAVLHTLTAVDKPFWDVVGDLSKQHPLLLRAGGGQMTLTRPVQNERFTAAGNFGIFHQALYRGSDVAAERAGPNPRRQLMLSLSVLPDPRLRTVMYAPATFTAIEDEKGRSLLQGPMQPQRFVPGVSSVRDVPLTLPPEPGTRIAKASGQMEFIIQLSEQAHLFKSPEKELNTPVKLGPHSIKLTQFEPTPTGIQLRVDIERDPAQPAQPAPNGKGTIPDGLRFPIGVALVDQYGIEVTRSVYVGTLYTARIVPPATAKGPFAVRVFTPERAKLVTASLELRDIPLPP